MPIIVNAVNDTPMNTAPASIAATEDIASPLTGIAFADVEAEAENATVVATLSVPSGGGTVKFTNSGTVEHNFTVEGKGISKDAEAGSSATIKVDLPAGTYQFHCKYHPTQMKGTLTVG